MIFSGMKTLICEALVAVLIIPVVMCFLGCGEDTEPEPDPTPTVLSINVQDGWEIPSNAIINVTFSEDMDVGSVFIAMDGTQQAVTSDDGITFRFTPEEQGEFELTIMGTDMIGQQLEPPFMPIRLKVIAPDRTPPEIIGDKCEPKNGATGVYSVDCAKLVIVFSERLAEIEEITFAEPIAVEPGIIADIGDLNFVNELSPDRKTLTIKLLQYSMSNLTMFTITLDVRDLAGNQATLTYSFTTMGRENGADYLLLFSTGLEHRADLDNGQISMALFHEFEDNGWPLSQKAAVEIMKRGREWWITDKDNDMEYFVQEVEGKLNIYDATMRLK